MRQRREAFSKVKYPYMNYCLLVEYLRDAMSYHDMHLLCSIQSDIFKLFERLRILCQPIFVIRTFDDKPS